MIESLLLLLALPLLISSAVLAVELALGMIPARSAPADGATAAWSAAILIPAHDEEVCIAATLAAIRTEAIPDFQILVVADNCSDNTAGVARASGADVVERHDASHRGKGFALAFGRARLMMAPPDCVIVLDADTRPAQGALELLVRSAMESGRPVQSAYSIQETASASSIARFSAIAFYMKNVVRQLGLSRLGVPVILTGSGMAFPWSIFSGLPIETGHVTEDLMLGIHCSLEGKVPIFLPQAVVTGDTSSDRGTAIQRRRWESGFFDTAKEYVPRLIRAGLRQRTVGLLWLALHLATPPLLLLLALDMLALTALLAVAIVAGPALALLALFSVTAAMVAVLIAAAILHGKRVAFRDFRAIPSYLVWKLGLSLRALARRERNWIRTSRE